MRLVLGDGAAGGTLDLMAPIAGPLLQKDVRLLADLADAVNAPAGTSAGQPSQPSPTVGLSALRLTG